MDKLKLRNAMKKRKPTFERQYANVMRQFKGSWNRPRGMHSKMRRGMRGKKLLPTVGFRSPLAVRGLTREGFVPVVINNTNDLSNFDVKKQIAVLAAGLGMRKRIEILNKAIELKVKLFNIKDATKYIEDAKKEVTDRQKLSLSRKSDKVKRKEENQKRQEKEKAKEEKKAAKAENKTEAKAEVKAEVKK